MRILSIIIPVYNEEETIEKIIQKIISTSIHNFSKQIIVIDDGSTDATGEILESIKDKYGYQLITHSQNKGKGAAIKSAVKEIQGDYVLIQDADLEYDPGDYIKLLNRISLDDVDVVYGSRNLDKSVSKRGYFFYYLGGRFLTFLTNILVGTDLTDVNTCYKLFPFEIFNEINIESDGFEFCEEVTIKTHMLGYRIGEVAITYSPRKFSEGKKIRFWNAFRSVSAIVKFKVKGNRVEK